MKISKILNRYDSSVFFRAGEEIAICQEFVWEILGKEDVLLSNIEMSISTINPKKKEWKRIKFDNSHGDFPFVHFIGKRKITKHDFSLLYNTKRFMIENDIPFTTIWIRIKSLSEE